MRKIIHYEQIDSTNEQAKKLVSLGEIKEVTLIYADLQTNGNGRRGNRWFHHKNKNLALTIVIPMEINSTPNSNLSLAFGVAISKSINKFFGIKPLLKWPNDIMINGKKVGGILVETIVYNEKRFIICGIGLNVYNELEHIDIELKDKATSILLELEKEKIATNNKSLGEFINIIGDEILEIYLQLEGNSPQILETYKKLSITIGKKVKIITNSQTIIADAIGINSHGNLIVRDESLKLTAIASGEVSIRNLDGSY